MPVKEIIISGFGGQGILSGGKLIAYAGMLDSKNVSWLPSYGPEMRGGTANCHVVVSEEPVGSPILNSADILIAMNGPSLDKFEDYIRENGIIITDSSLVERESSREDIGFFSIPATKLAGEMGNQTFAIVILLGKMLAETQVVTKDSFISSLKKVLPEKYQYMIPDEIKALEMGMES